MGYVETLCQLCGVSFAIARLRNKHEPREAAWDYQGDGFVDVDNYVDINDECGSDTGCSFTDRAEGDGEEEREHIAGPGCITTTGYNGNRITVQEMKGCRVVQCLAEKEEGWQAEDDDQDFELESDYFLTGLGEGSPDVAPLDNIKPARHGVSEMWIYNLVSTAHKMIDEIDTERHLAHRHVRHAGYTIPSDVLRDFQKDLPGTARQS